LGLLPVNTLLQEYLTVSKETSSEIEEKKSKFIASVKPVLKEEEALEFINAIKTRYWNATHNVYAYIIQGSSLVQRFSDDGEPSGTAGVPVLEAIKRTGVINAVVVVTRYFGGIKLGASGLVRAYGKSALTGLEKSGIVKMRLCTEYGIKLDYSSLGKVQSFISDMGYNIIDISYTHEVEIRAYIPEIKSSDFEKSIINLTNAKVSLIRGSSLYAPA
jgi:uncharacterized YigZ family protein